MKGKISTESGNVVIETDVLAKIAGLTAVECFGVVGMAMINVKDGLVKLLKRESITKGVNITISEDNSITVDFHIMTVYGVSIATIANNLMNTVKYKLESMTGMKVDKINVYVEGVRVID
jgi:uncharacterized alkaline shock family protein YloU